MKKQGNKGITLIALVITIIVLLILAGVSIAMLTGENGILTQAQRAKTETESAQAEEENILANYESYLNSYSGENTEFTDSRGNKVVVPEGFKIVNSEDNVEDGIIIEDVTHGATAGSQFVWIPVGTIQTSKGEVTINLDRYTFDDVTGKETGQAEGLIEEYFYKLEESDKGNIVAKDINDFKEKATNSGGYYIGRYEARTISERTKYTEDNELTQLTVRADDYVYNYTTQSQAAKLSRNMYNSNKFTSDLINSYSWDTAIVFLQEFDDRSNKGKPYSLQNSLNTSVANKGTNNLENDKHDVICNIWDMASNCYERSTETCLYDGAPCSDRGGHFETITNQTKSRGGIHTRYASARDSFRPILYL